LLYNFNACIDCKTDATLAIKPDKFANALLYIVLLQSNIKILAYHLAQNPANFA
jgi:hypothetical protein